jgi:hypothetical protein
LEQVIGFLQLKERWRADPAWLQYVGWAAPAEPVPLDGHVALAAWNRSVKLLLEELGTPIVVPVELTPEAARALRRTFGEFRAHLAAATSALSTIDALLPGLSVNSGSTLAGTCAEIATEFARAIATQMPWLEENALPDAALTTCCQACEAALERRTIVLAIDADTELRGVLGDHFAGIDTKIHEVEETLAFGRSFQNYSLPDRVVSKLTAGHPVDVARRISSVLGQVLEGLQNVRRFEADLAAFGEFDLKSWVGASADQALRSFATALMERAEAAADKIDELGPWSLYRTPKGGTGTRPR